MRKDSPVCPFSYVTCSLKTQFILQNSSISPLTFAFFVPILIFFSQIMSLLVRHRLLHCACLATSIYVFKNHTFNHSKLHFQNLYTVQCFHVFHGFNCRQTRRTMILVTNRVWLGNKVKKISGNNSESALSFVISACQRTCSIWRTHCKDD
jgi:hypothetical protein